MNYYKHARSFGSRMCSIPLNKSYVYIYIYVYVYVPVRIHFSILGVAIGVEELECKENNAIIEWFLSGIFELLGPRPATTVSLAMWYYTWYNRA